MDEVLQTSGLDESAHTTGRKSGMREEKREIVADSLGSELTPTEVARKHAISSGQLYTWRHRMREICMSGSMSGVWRRSHGRTSEAPPDERGGYRYVRPTVTAPHLDSTTSEPCASAFVTSVVRPAAVICVAPCVLGCTSGDAEFMALLTR